MMVAKILLMLSMLVPQHRVVLKWGPSGSPNIDHYNVYRSLTKGGPYTFGKSTTGLTLTDGTVRSGKTYYYVATAVDTGLHESDYSNETMAVIP